MTTSETARRLAEAMEWQWVEPALGIEDQFGYWRNATKSGHHSLVNAISWNPEHDISDALLAAELICEPKGWHFEIAYRAYPKLKPAVYVCAIEKYEGNDHVCRVGLDLPSTLCIALIVALDLDEEG